MTFDREPDLDNANVGMPDTRILGITEYVLGSYQIGSFLFYCHGGDLYGENQW
ncbi:hypothetical protein F230042K4_01940 [Mediterraneibacter glycyrrhizinilyticus]